jgi:hypothetical protein
VGALSLLNASETGEETRMKNRLAFAMVVITAFAGACKQAPPPPPPPPPAQMQASPTPVEPGMEMQNPAEKEGVD